MSLGPELVCLATRQQVTNALCARHFGIRRGLILATDHAQAPERAWVARLTEALPDVEWSKATIPHPVEDAPFSFETWAVPIVQEWRTIGQPLNFAIGGGQKTLGLGLWQTFVSFANREDLPHRACYPEQHSRRMVWFEHDGSVRHAPLDVPLALESLLRLNGFVALSSGAVLWRRGEQPAPSPRGLAECHDIFRSDVTYREACFRHAAAAWAEDPSSGVPVAELRRMIRELAERMIGSDQQGWAELGALAKKEAGRLLSRKWFDQTALPANAAATVRKMLEDFARGVRRRTLQAQIRPIEAPLAIMLRPSPGTTAYLQSLNDGRLKQAEDGSIAVEVGRQRVFPDEEGSFGRVFERLLFERVARWAGRQSRYVAEIRANVTFQDALSASRKVAGEWDLAFVTTSGRLVVVDAKSFDRGHEEERAQRYVVDRAGGDFAERFSAIPACAPEADADGAAVYPWYPAGLRALANQPSPPGGVRSVLTFDAGEAFEAQLDYIFGGVPPLA